MEATERTKGNRLDDGAIMKYCSKCKETKPLSAYSKSRIRKDGLSLICKECSKKNHRLWYEKNKGKAVQQSTAWRLKNRDRYRQWQKEYAKREALKIMNTRLGKYGITLKDYDELLSLQNNACGCCGSKESGNRTGRFCVDHDHLTGKVRGLLCTSCNLGIGMLGDDLHSLLNAINYIYRSDKAHDDEYMKTKK